MAYAHRPPYKIARPFLYCYSQTCKLAAACGYSELASAGIPVVEMEGGFEAWVKNERFVER